MQAKTAAFDFQTTSDTPHVQTHRFDHARDNEFWTARLNRDIRRVLQKQGGDTLALA